MRIVTYAHGCIFTIKSNCMIMKDFIAAVLFMILGPTMYHKWTLILLTLLLR